jgi:hypothetical protein
MSDYKPSFAVGAHARVASREALERFRREWKHHHPLQVDQLSSAGQAFLVSRVTIYHGGDCLYELSGAPGIWHERCLQDPRELGVAAVAFRALPGLPPYGPAAISFPPRFARSGREGFVVEFLPGTPDAWVGNFEPGLGGGYTGVHDHPNGRDMLVFSSGTGVIIDPAKRQFVAELPYSGFVFSVHPVTDPPGVICSAQDLTFFRLGPAGIVWETRRLSLDGFRDVVLTDTRITGAGMELGRDGEATWKSFEVDLRTGDAKGGPYVPFP